MAQAADIARAEFRLRRAVERLPVGALAKDGIVIADERDYADGAGAGLAPPGPGVSRRRRAPRRAFSPGGP